MSSAVKSEQWMTKTAVTASVDASYNSLMTGSGSITSSHSITITEGQHQTSSEFNSNFDGGNFAVYKDQEAWSQSVQENPTISEYSLTPIYALLPGEEYKSSRRILKAAVERAVKEFGDHIPNFSIKPTIMQVAPIESGYRYSRDYRTSMTYKADPPDGYYICGSGYSAELSMSAVRIDGVNAKLNTGWKRVWIDKGTGWTGRVSIWVPTSDDPDFVPCGLTVVSSGQGHDGYDTPFHNVAMLNLAVTTPIWVGFFPETERHVLRVGWREYNLQNPWQANLFHSNDSINSFINPLERVYGPRWSMFKPLENDSDSPSCK